MFANKQKVPEIIDFCTKFPLDAWAVKLYEMLISVGVFVDSERKNVIQKHNLSIWTNKYIKPRKN